MNPVGIITLINAAISLLISITGLGCGISYANSSMAGDWQKTFSHIALYPGSLLAGNSLLFLVMISAGFWFVVLMLTTVPAWLLLSKHKSS
jgi:hypothetical protein